MATQSLTTTSFVRDWAEFEEKLQWLHSQVSSDHPVLEEPIFRGQGNAEWKLTTTLERFADTERNRTALSLRAYYRKITAAKRLLEGLTGKQWADVPDPLEFEDRLQQDPFRWLDLFLNKQPGIYEYLVYLRHHDFPSPLLDWTASPYVAAFFAFNAVEPGADHVCVYAFLRSRQRSVSGDPHFFTVGPYMCTDKRHYVQQCRYSMCVGRDGDDYCFRSHEDVLVNANGTQGQLFKLRMPVVERRTVLRKLELMNINEYSLFGSEDALVRTISQRECYFSDWQL